MSVFNHCIDRGMSKMKLAAKKDSPSDCGKVNLFYGDYY